MISLVEEVEEASAKEKKKHKRGSTMSAKMKVPDVPSRGDKVKPHRSSDEDTGSDSDTQNSSPDKKKNKKKRHDREKSKEDTLPRTSHAAQVWIFTLFLV